MMTKNTSRRRRVLKELASIPLFAVLICFFSETIAQPAAISKEEFYKGAQIVMQMGTENYVTKKYEELSEAQRDDLPKPLSPSADLVNRWKSYEQYPVLVNSTLPDNTGGPEQCRIFIDGKNVPSETLNQFKANDFASYHDSKFTKDKFTLISVNLYTTKYVKSLSEGSKQMMITEGQAFVGRLNPPFIIPKKYQ